VSFLDRIRRFWSPAPPPDHPLNAQERDEEHWASADDERSRAPESLGGGYFDPDDDPAARY